MRGKRLEKEIKYREEYEGKEEYEGREEGSS